MTPNLRVYLPFGMAIPMVLLLLVACTKVKEPTLEATPVVCGLDEINAAALSVARLETELGTGTGFLIDEDTMVTARHVTEGSDDVLIEFADGTFDHGRAVESLSLDIAVVRLAEPRPGLGLEWGHSSTVRPGETVTAIGYPLGSTGDPTLTKGTVSRFTRSSDGVEYIQTDAALNFGNSGGPLLDECGRVLGIVTLKAEGAEGIALAMVADQARGEAERIASLPPAPIPSRTPTPLPSATRVAFTPTVIKVTIPPTPEVVQWGASATWDYVMSGLIADCESPVATIECALRHIEARGANPEVRAFLIANEAFLTQFDEYGVVDFGRISAPWINMARGEPVFLNGDFGLLHPHMLLPDDWAQRPSYTNVASGAFAFFEYAMLKSADTSGDGQTFILAIPIKKGRAGPPLGYLNVEYRFDSSGRLSGVTVLPYMVD